MYVFVFILNIISSSSPTTCCSGDLWINNNNNLWPTLDQDMLWKKLIIVLVVTIRHCPRISIYNNWPLSVGGAARLQETPQIRPIISLNGLSPTLLSPNYYYVPFHKLCCSKTMYSTALDSFSHYSVLTNFTVVSFSWTISTSGKQRQPGLLVLRRCTSYICYALLLILHRRRSHNYFFEWSPTR